MRRPLFLYALLACASQARVAFAGWATLDGGAWHRERVLALIEAPGSVTGPVTVACDGALLSGGLVQNASFCEGYANGWYLDASSGLYKKNASTELTATGNVDPELNSYFPFDSLLPATNPQAQDEGQVGLRVVTQTGWGGGANVSLGSQAGVVWGVHATLSSVHSTATTAAVLFSFYLGGASNSNTTATGQLVPTPSPAAFIPRDPLAPINATVTWGGGVISLFPTCLQYQRVYTSGGYVYTSPIVCHAVWSDLDYATSYQYSISATVQLSGGAVTYNTPATATSAAGSALPLSFRTPPAPGAPQWPYNWLLSGDVGQTFNSSLTAQYINTYAASLGATGLHQILNVGDLTYSDNYGPASVDETGSGTNQNRWDSMATMWQPVFGQTLSMHLAGNHEVETSGISASITSTSNSTSFGVSHANTPFQSYATRVPHGALPTSSLGDTWSNLYYSQTLGPVHVIVLCNYVPFEAGTEQYNWFIADVAGVNRTLTPWLIVATHAAPYHSYVSHYKEMDCFLSVYEPLFLTYSVDLVFSGHVHAYERTHPIYQYASNACGPAYITIGDGGNIEGPYRNFVDELVPGTSTTFCANSFSTTNASYYPGVPSYQRAGQSSSCPTATFQPANGVGRQPGVVPLAGSSPPRYFCQTSQPEWSAYRDPSFGFGSLTFLNASAAVFTWYRNQDQSPGSPLVGADHAIYTRATSCASAPPPPPSPPLKKKGRRAAVIAGSTVAGSAGIGAAAAGIYYYRRLNGRLATADGGAAARLLDDEYVEAPTRREQLGRIDR